MKGLKSQINYLACEKSVQKYLKSLNDYEIRKLYEHFEYTPFPILLMREYLQRFNNKKIQVDNCSSSKFKNIALENI